MFAEEVAGQAQATDTSWTVLFIGWGSYQNCNYRGFMGQKDLSAASGIPVKHQPDEKYTQSFPLTTVFIVTNPEVTV